MGSNNTRIRGVALELLFHQGPMTVISLRDAIQSAGGIRVVPSQQRITALLSRYRLRLLDQRRCKLTTVGNTRLFTISTAKLFIHLTT